ncbi:MAG: peptidoglycan editing factor PgeF [Cyanobacteria bacterium REEB67]|nr:peptidoglycan editing factor PgeF [Cyanobacteria bacterium REEB67]
MNTLKETDSPRIQAALKANAWVTNQFGALPLLQSPLLLEEAPNGLQHAFTTRHGGETPAPYDSFNLGRHVADGTLKGDALANREVLCDALSFKHGWMKVPGQVHSGNVVEIVDPHSEPDLSGVDALATSLVGVPLLLHFADCVPVIVYERQKKLLAIAHAGWRGTAQAIVKNSVQALCEMGGSPEFMIGAVGPAIGTCCYPTGPDVVEQLMATVCGSSAGSAEEDEEIRRNLVVTAVDHSVRPNLKAINALQLLQAGVARVDVSDLCTACHPELFYSHRQSGGKTGRQGAIACLIF